MCVVGVCVCRCSNWLILLTISSISLYFGSCIVTHSSHDGFKVFFLMLVVNLRSLPILTSQNGSLKPNRRNQSIIDHNSQPPIYLDRFVNWANQINSIKPGYSFYHITNCSYISAIHHGLFTIIFLTPLSNTLAYISRNTF